MNVQLIGFRKF